MTAACRELRLTGRPASPGLAAGPLFVLATRPAATRRRHRRSRARGRAPCAPPSPPPIDDLEAAARQADGDAADILEFQVAMLEDDALAERRLRRHRDGSPADARLERRRWLREIADYETADDEYFRARAADLADLRDRVLRHLSGAEPPGERCRPAPSWSRATCRRRGSSASTGAAAAAIAAGRRQPDQPCRHAGARPRRADGGRPRGDRLPVRAGRAMVDGDAAQSSSTPMPGTRADFEPRAAATGRRSRRPHSRSWSAGPPPCPDGTPVR